MLLEDRAQQVVRRDAGIDMFQGEKTRELRLQAMYPNCMLVCWNTNK